MEVNPGSGVITEGANTAYNLISAARLPRVNSDNTVTNVIQVTAQSILYLVTYTWFVETATWDGDGGPNAIELKTADVNQVCGYQHVIGFRTQQDQDASQLLENYAIVTVGTADGSIQDDAPPIEMLNINTPATFTAIDTVWKRLQAAGAS